MRRLAPSDQRRMPWKNGGGSTTELVIEPPGAAIGGEPFLYRISIADVASDGPFSRFPGVDRIIMMVSGGGMVLDAGGHGRIELRMPFEPRAFSGDWEVSGMLVAGPVQDFNVMVDRDRASATLEVHTLAPGASIAVDATRRDPCILHVFEGELAEAGTGDTLIAEAPAELRVTGANRARVAVVRISLRVGTEAPG